MVVTNTQADPWFKGGLKFPSRTKVSDVGEILRAHKPGEPLTPQLKEQLLEARRNSWMYELKYMPNDPWGNCEFASSNRTVVRLKDTPVGKVLAISRVFDRQGCYHFIRAATDRPDLYFVAGLNRSGRWVWLSVETELVEGRQGFDTWDYYRVKSIFYREVWAPELVENLGGEFSSFWRALSEYILHWVEERKRLLEMATNQARLTAIDDALMLLYFGPQD